MDLSVIAAMASSVLAPYLAKGGEAFASEFGKSAGQKIFELSDLIKSRFKGDKDAETILTLAEKDPQSSARLASLEGEIGKKMKEDPDFAAKVQRLVDDLQKGGGGRTAFDQRGQTVHGSQTNIAGNVNRPVLSGNFSGPVNTDKSK